MAKRKLGKCKLGKTRLSDDELVRRAQDIETQYLIDLLCIKLHEKYGFGARRLTDLVGDVMQEHEDNIRLFAFRTQAEEDEALRYRYHLDKELQAIFKDKFSPFDERYPYAKRINVK